MTLVLGGFCRIGAGGGGGCGGGQFGSGKRQNCSKLQNIINNEKHCNHSTQLVLYYRVIFLTGPPLNSLSVGR